MKTMKKKKKQINTDVVVMTGLAGAGMSSALKHLEDLGFEVFDNFPLTLAKALIKDSKQPRIAIGIDSRTRGFSTTSVLRTVKDLKAKLVFLTADDGILQKRFTETRRRHPLAKDRPAMDGIKQERRLLWDLQSKADMVIDTSELSIHDLRHILESAFAGVNSNRLTVTLKSFAYRHGIPREADLVMDVRFLKNPHWVKKLKPKTGLDKAVGAYIESDPAFKFFIGNYKKLLKPLLPLYAEEGKSYLTIAVGCSGGKHRSVYTAKTLGAWIESLGYTTRTEHRDMRR